MLLATAVTLSSKPTLPTVMFDLTKEKTKLEMVFHVTKSNPLVKVESVTDTTVLKPASERSVLVM